MFWLPFLLRQRRWEVAVSSYLIFFKVWLLKLKLTFIGLNFALGFFDDELFNVFRWINGRFRLMFHFLLPGVALKTLRLPGGMFWNHSRVMFWSGSRDVVLPCLYNFLLFRLLWNLTWQSLVWEMWWWECGLNGVQRMQLLCQVDIKTINPLCGNSV